MCGIGGIVWGGQQGDREATLFRCIDALQHRGPDECGIYLDGYAGLAHTRLAIIAPVCGQQPYSRGTDVLVFNGEIFNFPELKRELAAGGASIASNSDTEVLFALLEADGMDALKRLNGQFAFCLYRPVQRSLILARDPFGEKPLYYYFRNGVFAFSSEVKGLVALLDRGFKLVTESMEEINAYWAHDPRSSVFRDLRSVPPGGVLEFSDGTIRTSYFRVFRRHPGPEAGPQQVRDLVSVSVERRMLSDVPLGVYLSGGLDSSIVSFEVARRTTGSLRSYSIAFEDERFDETRFQQLVSKRLGTTHRSITISYDDVVDNLTSALRFAESPSFRTGFVGLYLLSQVVEQDGIKVILTGEGADEVLLGYDLFWQIHVRERVRRGATIDQVRHILERLNQFIITDEDRSRMIAYGFSSAKQFAGDNSMLSSHIERYNLGLPFSHMLVAEGRQGSPREHAGDRWRSYLNDKYTNLGQESELQRSQTIETETLLSGHLLSVQGDRASMAHSVETRAPFLDPDLVSAMYSKGTEVLLNGEHTEKQLLKDAYSDALPEEVIDRQKFPYRTPDGFAFLRGRGRELCYDVVADRRNSASILDLDKFTKFLDAVTARDHIRPRDNHTLMMGLTTLIVEKLFSSPKNILPPSTQVRQRPPGRRLATQYGTIVLVSTRPAQ
jgi:asparagine synthase (glutamine-hydrolysing)